MGLSEGGTPVSTTDGEDSKLGDDDGSADSGGNLLRRLDSETNVALGVTNDNDGLEAGTLTGAGLLLDGLDLELGKPNQLCSCPQMDRMPAELQQPSFTTRRGHRQVEYSNTQISKCLYSNRCSADPLQFELLRPSDPPPV